MDEGLSSSTASDDYQRLQMGKDANENRAVCPQADPATNDKALSASRSDRSRRSNAEEESARVLFLGHKSTRRISHRSREEATTSAGQGYCQLAMCMCVCPSLSSVPVFGVVRVGQARS
jgi:hypothetical protein